MENNNNRIAWYQDQSGFTWKEAVITFAFFGLIVLVAGFILYHSRQENRDLKRLSDVKAIQHALELYFYDCNQYPLNIRQGGQISGVEQCQGSVYLAKVPADPSGVDYSYTPCRDETIKECGETATEPKAYKLIYELESETDGLPEGQHLAVPGNYAAK